MNHIIAVAGMPGSGKTTALEIARDEFDFRYIRFGQLTIDTVRERGLEVNPKNEKIVREDLRKEFGMGAYALKNIPQINAFLEKGHVVIDGLYSWSEYKVLKEEYRENISVLAVHAPPALRHKRLSERQSDASDTAANNRTISLEDAQKRDYAEIENIEKGGPIAMADYMIVNDGDFEKYKQALRNVFSHYAR